ncbi:orotate phosphoribosyltransferase [Basilea psittacipulmonis]|uniref:Orotate phosphoribosyltransferase n=1 Tax=Basilea psittacipulmonis DSM 24701 TaxID=1072685 RepID=A0A077DFD6_9BURK|nr:orotate phosphoribosyltransferase [Basilea psittacipulmonis]AIL32107.1 orotate phosphoribosyltransferase [Basilea psittacipulmonis DSM 24701]
MNALRLDFVRFALEQGVLKFGEFETKSGRLSPYFFNAGLFNTGRSLGRLATYYAETLLQSNVEFDMIFGPAYKGISLAAATAMVLSEKTGRDIPYAFNRKEKKDHGEGGVLVGSPLKGKVIIIDDVITAGTSVRESVDIIQGQQATVAGVLIALDRMEKAGNATDVSSLSAVQEVQNTYHFPVISIASLNDIMMFLKEDDRFQTYEASVEAYRRRYGV